MWLFSLSMLHYVCQLVTDVAVWCWAGHERQVDGSLFAEIQLSAVVRKPKDTETLILS